MCRFDFDKQEDSYGMSIEKIPFVYPKDPFGAASLRYAIVAENFVFLAKFYKMDIFI